MKVRVGGQDNEWSGTWRGKASYYGLQIWCFKKSQKRKIWNSHEVPWFHVVKVSPRKEKNNMINYHANLCYSHHWNAKFTFCSQEINVNILCWGPSPLVSQIPPCAVSNLESFPHSSFSQVVMYPTVNEKFYYSFLENILIADNVPSSVPSRQSLRPYVTTYVMFMEANIILNCEIWNLYLYDQEQQKGITPTTPIPHGTGGNQARAWYKGIRQEK